MLFLLGRAQESDHHGARAGEWEWYLGVTGVVVLADSAPAAARAPTTCKHRRISRCCVRRLTIADAGSVHSRNRCYGLNGSSGGGQTGSSNHAAPARIGVRPRRVLDAPNFNSSSVPSNRRQ